MYLFGGLFCCMSAAALSAIGWDRKWHAEKLRSVTRVNQLNDLDAFCKAHPVVVSVTGRVGSETPIDCSGLECVIVTETYERIFKKRNRSGFWEENSDLMHSRSKEVPWYLDDGNGHVYVVGARGNPGLPLTVASKDFEKSGKYCSTCGCETLDNQRGREMLGVERKERVLPVGTTLTIVGEAIKGDDGKIQIQKPLKGTFYVSQMNIDQLIEDYENNARWIHFAGKSFAVLGGFLITKQALDWIQ